MFVYTNIVHTYIQKQANYLAITVKGDLLRKIAIVAEILIGVLLSWFAYRTDVRADKLDKQETKYKEREQLVESLSKQRDNLQNLLNIQVSETEKWRKSDSTMRANLAKSVPTKRKRAVPKK